MKSGTLIYLIWFSLLIYPSAVLCQGRVWQVPTNSMENRLVLTIKNDGNQETGAIDLIVRDMPPHVDFQASEMVLKSLPPPETRRWI